MTDQNIVANVPQTPHPLAPLIVTVLGDIPEGCIIDAIPGPETLILTVKPGSLDDAWWEDHAFSLYLDDPIKTDDGVVIADVGHFHIPLVLPVVLYRIQQEVMQHEGRDDWRAVLAHLTTPGVLPDGAEFDAAMRLSPLASEYLQRIESGAKAGLFVQPANDTPPSTDLPGGLQA